jgi:DNA-binding transcriptional ArsR family regulator
MTKGAPPLRGFLALAGALSDSNRVRMLLALRGRELCVCQIVELLDLAPSTVSKHLSVLRQADLVDYRKTGRWAYYRRGHGATPAVREALRWVDDTLSRDDQVKRDHARLREILKVSPEELCQRTNPR